MGSYLAEKYTIPGGCWVCVMNRDQLSFAQLNRESFL